MPAQTPPAPPQFGAQILPQSALKAEDSESEASEGPMEADDEVLIDASAPPPPATIPAPATPPAMLPPLGPPPLAPPTGQWQQPARLTPATVVMIKYTRLVDVRFDVDMLGRAMTRRNSRHDTLNKRMMIRGRFRSIKNDAIRFARRH